MERLSNVQLKQLKRQSKMHQSLKQMSVEEFKGIIF